MKIRVSVVDDEDGIRTSLKVVLGLSDEFEAVGLHSDAQAALDQVPQEKPQVVLMDVRLRGMSGIECTRRLKQLMPEVKVIVLTSARDDQTVYDSLTAGADGFLHKENCLVDCPKAIRDVMFGSPLSPHAGRLLVQYVQRLRQARQSDDFLTGREKSILDLLTQGWTDKEICSGLNIGLGTVHTHLQNIYKKLDVHSRGQAVARYLGHLGGGTEPPADDARPGQR